MPPRRPAATPPAHRLGRRRRWPASRPVPCPPPDDLPYVDGDDCGWARHGREGGLGGPAAGGDADEAGELVLAGGGEGERRGCPRTLGEQPIPQRVRRGQSGAVRPGEEQ